MRRQGIASKLLKTAMSYFENGFRAQVSNHSSIILHYKLGFRAIDDNGQELSIEDTILKREEKSSIMMISPKLISEYSLKYSINP